MSSFPDQSDRAGYLREQPGNQLWDAQHCGVSCGVSQEMSREIWSEGGQR